MHSREAATHRYLAKVPVLIGLDGKMGALPLAAAADSRVTHSQRAACKQCTKSENDAFGDTVGSDSALRCTSV